MMRIKNGILIISKLHCYIILLYFFISMPFLELSAGKTDVFKFYYVDTTKHVKIERKTVLEELFNDDDFSVRGWIDGYMNNIIEDEERGPVGMWAWNEGDKTPKNFSSMRKDLGRDYEKLFIKYYVKYDDDWIGSQKNYHPHLIAIRSNYDFFILGEYGGGANAYLTVYFDSWVNPKNNKIHPWFQLQDSRNINYDYGMPPQNIADKTEYRSVGGCNGCLNGQDCGTNDTCFNISNNYWYSAREWVIEDIYYLRDKWIKEEYYIEMNSIKNGKGIPDGILKIWHDDKLIFKSANMLFRTGKYPDMSFRQIGFFPYIGDGSPVHQSMFIDNLKIYKHNIKDLSQSAN